MDKWRRETASLLVLAGPIVMGQVGQMLIQVVDTAMVGRLGAVPTAAAALGSNVLHLFLLLGFGLAIPVQVLTAQAHGRQDWEGGLHVLRHGLLILAGYATLCLILMLVLRDALGLLGQPQAVVEEAIPYTGWLAFSMLPALLCHVLKNFCEANDAPWLPFVAMTLGVVLNAFFNWLFIYGNLGMPRLELEGAGVATVLARVVMLLLLLGFMARRWPRQLHWHPRYWKDTRLAELRAMLSIGIPGALQLLFEAGAFIFAVVMMGWFGVVEQAAHHVAITYVAMVFMVPLGLSFATSIRVGRAMGAADTALARTSGFTGMGCALVFMIFMASLTWLGRETLPRLFIHEAPVVSLAATYLGIAAVFMVFDGLQVAALGALRGLADVRWPAFLLFLAFWVLGIPLGAVLGFACGWGGEGLWWGLALGLACTATAMIWRFHRLTRRQTRDGQVPPC